MDMQKVLAESQSSVKLIRNSRGYGWEIKIYDFDADKIIPTIKEKDTELRKEYAPDLEPE